MGSPTDKVCFPHGFGGKMRLRSIAFLIFIAVLSVILFSCADKTDKTRFEEYANIRKIDLTLSDQEHILAMAKAMLANQKFERKTEEHRLVYSPGARGVWISLMRPKERALTAFGFGPSLEEAIKTAASLLKRMAQGNEITASKVRVDIIDMTSDRKTAKMSARWRSDIAHEGIIFNTTPLAAILPQEIIGFEIIDGKGKYSAGGMKRLVSERVIGNILRDNFQDESENEYVLCKTISFVEDENGKIKLLYGINYLDIAPTAENIIGSAVAAGDYLKSNISYETGEFNYRHYPQRNQDSKSYSNIRHAGTIMAMAELYEAKKDPELLKAVEAGIKWILANIADPKPEDAAKGYHFKTFTEAKEKEAKAGGAAMAIAALARYSMATGDRKYLPLMQDLARFIQFSVQPDGSLVSRYRYDDKDTQDSESSFYPGECAFGLALLYKIDNNPEWLATIFKMEDYLRTVRDKNASSAEILHDHWLVLAMNELGPEVKKSEYKQHMFAIGDSIVKAQKTGGDHLDDVGGFSDNSSSTSTASRGEALNALYLMAKREGDQERAERYWKAEMLASHFLLRMQFNEANALFFPAPNKALGGVMEKFIKPDIQIDSVQHYIGAQVRTWRELSLRNPTGK
jgi:hypothetical protein